MDPPFWHIAASAHDESFTNLPSGGFLSLCVFPPFKLVFWLRVSSPQLVAASALSPVMWGPFSADASSIDALPTVIIPYVIIMTVCVASQS